MFQFNYTDLSKFFVSIGVALIGFAFLLPWLYSSESFDLLIKKDELTTLTDTARHLIYKRQQILSYSPGIIVFVSAAAVLTGLILTAKGVNGWFREEKLKRQASELANRMASSVNAQDFSSPDAANELTRSHEAPAKIVARVPINNLWILNHWGSNVASITRDGKMIFKGEKTRLATDGSHINLQNVLTIGSAYLISCFVKAAPGTTGMFQLWCHDNIGIDPHGAESAVPYATPSVEGEKCLLRFEAKVNGNLRIHLQYSPGKGHIEVSDVTISEIPMANA